ncbi:MAG: electron transfer flavoprotein subunit alpha/FixB family protein [Deltaproteobacteria bacterium]|nr:electron transfer flavoprotein subunit alpha/FixB family protein [Deltaproteobacteria bacterium]
MNVLIVAEQQGGTLRKASLNAVGAGLALAQKTGGELHLALLGSGLDKAAEDLKAYGGKVLHVLDAPELKDPLAEPFSQAIAALAKAVNATWIGAAATAIGKDVLPRVAARMGAGMATDVLGFEGSAEKIVLRRPMWAGNVFAEVEITTLVKVFTVRTTEFPAAAKAATAAEVKKEAPQLAGKPKARFVSFKAIQSARPELTEAKVVISGGRGTKGDFKPVENLADEMHAAVGASRAAVDAGWVPNDLQVGQTGKVVAPELYIAAGISGAIQHLAGMKGSKVIVAVNTNAEAAIFQVADYGLVGDLFKVLPELTAAVKAGK